MYQFLAFGETNPETDQDIRMLPLDGEPIPETFRATPFLEGFAKFSPDGDWVAYQSDRSGQMEVWVQPYRGEGAAVQVSTGGGVQPRWSLDGRELFFRRESAVVAVPIDTTGSLTIGEPQVLWQNDRWTPPYTYDVAADGETFIVALTTGDAEPAKPIIVQNWFEELKRLVPVR